MRIFIIDYARKMRFVELTLINKSVPRRGMDLSAIYNPFSYWLFKGFKRKDMKERGTSGRDYFVE